MADRKAERILLAVACAAAIAGLAAGACPGEEGAGQALRFSFRKDRPLSYRMRVTASTAQTITCGKQSIESPPQGQDVTFEMRVAPGDPDEKGHVPCTIAIANFKGAVTFTSEGRNITVKVNGKDAVLETEGKVLMDTAKGVNVEQAENLLRAMALRGGEAKVVVDDRGCKQKIEGDPAVAKWFASASQALFPLLLPERAVRPGDTWDELYDMQAIDRFRLKEPLKPTMKYTFKPPAPDAPKGLADIASICKMDVKDLEAVPPPEQAESISRFTIKSMTIDASGTAAFDQAAGEFVRGTRRSTVKSLIVVKPVMGEEQVAKVEGSVEVSYELAPAAQKP